MQNGSFWGAKNIKILKFVNGFFLLMSDNNSNFKLSGTKFGFKCYYIGLQFVMELINFYF